MADKSKMTVAEMLAAARRADGAGSAPAEAAKREAAPAQAAPAAKPPVAPVVPAAKQSAAGAGGRPSVAEMLAAARAGKQDDGAAAPGPVAKEKPATPKPTAKVAVAAASKKEAPAAAAGPIDTQSILTAARGGTKPGPMSKAEAAAKGASAPPDAKKARAKEAIVVPPMPTKPDYAKPGAQRKAEEKAERRAFLFGLSALAVGFFALGTTLAVWTLATVRFMFPNILREPPSRFTVGFPDQFPAGQVEEKFKAQFGVWVVNAEYNGEQQIVALKSVCTHLGCTPNWLEAEQKFKCPCHGSGFYKDGINFEGPAPRPLERYAVSVAPSGEIEIDKSRTFQEEMGQWNDPASYIPV